MITRGRNMMRLDKYLVEMEVGSRSQVKESIKKGLVSVNGIKASRPETKIDENKDIISYQGKALSYTKNEYYMLHKPAGVVSATTDNYDTTVLDLLKDAKGKNLFPVGRLDKDTEGLLLITNDGGLSHDLLSPKKHVDKEYFVELRYPVTKQEISLLEEGVDIGDEKRTLPATVMLIDKTHVSIVIQEGRFHQVKRMFQAVSNEVCYLKRMRMGSLRLDESLQPGEYRSLTETEINFLKSVQKRG